MKYSKNNGPSLVCSGSRGASMVEYAVLLVGVLLLAAGAFKSLGPKIGRAAEAAQEHL